MNTLSPEMNQPKSQRDIDHQRCDILGQYLNPFAGDIYRSALTAFERFSALRAANFRINPRSNYISGGMNGDGELEIHIGTEASAITPRIKSRISERFSLPSDQDLPDGIYQLIIIAHELGHVIQKDPLFHEFYGDYDTTTYNAQNDYEAYVYSDNEVLADFIATQILSNSILGGAIGLMPPAEEPTAWRQWGDQHRVDRTIQEYGDIVYDIVHE